MPFLSENDFSGSYQACGSRTSVGGQATYEGKILFTNMPRKHVQGVLAQDLCLATNKSKTPELHPVVYLYGHQTNTQWIIRGRTLPVGKDYQELILLIPFVQRNKSDKWHNYVVIIYLNDKAAQKLGNTYYGYAKHKARFEETTTDFTVLVHGRPTFHSTTKTLGPWQPSRAAELTLPNYKNIQTIFEMPVLGVKQGRKKLTFSCSYFEWEYSSVEVAPIQSQHRFLHGDTFTSEKDCAIAIRNLRWRITFPPPKCQF